MPRCYNHNYHSRCIYHITLKKAPEAPTFGHLCGNYPEVRIARSPLGEIIERQLRQIPALNSALRVLQYCIMPDHVHLLLFVTTTITEHPGNYIGRFKILCHQEYREKAGADITIFEDDFYDCILYPSRSLDTLYRYLRENPRRLAVRRAHPDTRFC